MVAQILALIALPPVNLLLLAIAGALLWRWRPATGRALTAIGLSGLLLLALPAVSGPLMRGLTVARPAAAPDAAPPAAIVILGGDVAMGVTGEDIGFLTLQRLRGGAALQRASGLPVLATGGVIGDGATPLAVLMARSLAADFGVPVRWLEPKSANTWQNAQLSAAILKQAGIGKVFVVTHAWHMRRALIAFAAAGLAAVPAPLPQAPVPEFSASLLVPRVSSWQQSYFALHEWIGTAWYAWRARDR